MSLVFISYRRSDTGALASRIYNELQREFGRDSIFMDVDQISGGVSWRKRLEGLRFYQYCTKWKRELVAFFYEKCGAHQAGIPSPGSCGTD